ncbi:MAG: GTP-binding protein [Promethearchaeota archaeon]
MRNSGFVMKIVLCGDSNVGKETLLSRYLGKSFQSTYRMTIGADFAVKHININYKGICYPIKFQIWDLAGHPRFDIVRGLYYAGALAAIFVFDVTNRTSFENLPSWINEYFNQNGRGVQPLVLLGNKSDLRDTVIDPVSFEEGQALAVSLSQETSGLGFSIAYFETSVLTGQNISEAFQFIGKSFLSFNEFRKKKENNQLISKKIYCPFCGAFQVVTGMYKRTHQNYAVCLKCKNTL